jgi:hypothetical protein
MANKEWHLEKTYDSLMTYGLNGVRYIPLINGGAIIALLAFLGDNPEKAEELTSATHFFIAGVVVGGILNITAYLTQLMLYIEERDHPPKESHGIFLWLSILLIIVGLGCFVAGALKTTHAFHHSETQKSESLKELKDKN